MRLAALAAAIAFVGMPAAAQTLVLRHPADANKDGVVSDEERADYLMGDPDRPAPEIGVQAPKSSGDGINFTVTEPTNELDKRAVPASDFVKAQNAQAEKARKD